MFFLQPTIVSLVIEGRVVRLLVTKGRSVLSWAVVPFNPALVRAGVITRPQDMADIIRQATERVRFSGRLAATFPGVGVVSRVMTLPRGVTADLDTVVLHPVALAGWFGLFVTSINLLPVGQLDGGHVLYALRGRSSWLVPALLLGALVWLGTHGWPGWIIWAVIITVLVRVGHPPTEEDHVPLGRGRAIAAILTFVIFVLTFVAEPFRIGQ